MLGSSPDRVWAPHSLLHMIPTTMRLSHQISPTSLSNAFSAGRRHLTTTASLLRVYQEGDVVLLREKRDPSHDGLLVRLRASKEIATHRGKLQHAEIIGKNVRQVVQTSSGHGYRIHEPTLAEYVRLSPRLVTPIYPTDANIIVSLLDIHVDTPPAIPDNAPPLEILEAGTGHGALTLHLSRAIHAANPPLPTPPPRISAAESETTDTEQPGIEDPVYGGETVSSLADSSFETWKSSRRAILHTVDASAKYSKHARKTVQTFRHGMYARNVDFHAGDVSTWIAAEMAARKTTLPFLSHVFLDLPSANLHLPNVAPALHVDGLLAVFNPSITQIVECVNAVREQRLPFVLDQVVELGAGCIRQWDVRNVVPRAMSRKTVAETEGSESEAQASVSGAGNDVATQSTSDVAVDSSGAYPQVASVDQGLRARDAELFHNSAKREPRSRHMVCRPKAYERVVGGGFLGLWRRMEPAKEQKE